MKIIVAGDGQVGRAVTRQLSREGYDLTVIDPNPEVLAASETRYDVMIVQGNAATMGTLRTAGVESADLLIAATSADEVNLLCCLTARKMNPSIHTIARVRNPEYTEQQFAMREELGLSMTVNPEKVAAEEIYRTLQIPAFVGRDTFAKGKVEIVELEVRADSKLAGVPLNQLNQIVGVKVLVCAVTRDEETVIPNGSYVIQPGDHIHVTAQADKLARFMKNLKISTHPVNSVLVIGGGRVGFYLTQLLLAGGMNVKIIEENYDRCVELATAFPKASVYHGNGTSQKVLDTEGIEHADAVVTLTGSDEENLIVSMYANQLGVKKVITQITHMEHTAMFEKMGAGTMVVPKDLCSAHIVRYVRAMYNQTGEMLALHRVAGERVEAMEFRVDENVRYCGIPLKDIPLRKNILLASVSRRGEPVIPDGSTAFQPGDTAIVVASDIQPPIRQMNDIFAR
ncbi:MAG: Trk system potassium transporter TrkA [Oscillospiraceae bacterium]|nr:Trk system potassium transporter TrkA [Oscillospiraceae bacterium]